MPFQPGGTPGSSGQANPGFGMSADVQTSRDMGDDWLARFRQWVDLHKYYPKNAAALGHQGRVTVRFVLAPDGTVRSIEMIRPSSSQLLDFNLMTLFRPGVKIPAPPPGALPEGDAITFTMRYILTGRY
jgi:protein TonB